MRIGLRQLRAFLLSLAIGAVALSAACQDASRYAQLKRVINANTGFAHFTRGTNAYTLYALRECVTEDDIPTLIALLDDKDGPTRLAAMYVLADLGDKGRAALRESLSSSRDAIQRMDIGDAIKASTSPDYRPILQYPMTEAERGRIHGCPATSR